MIILRLYSKTWKNLKTAEERKKKAEELKEARKRINKYRDELTEKYKQDMEKSGFGKNFAKDGKRIRTEEVMSRYKKDMEDIKNYMSSILDSRKKSKPKPKKTPDPKPQEEELMDKIIKGGNKVKEVMKNPKVKKWGLITAGAGAGTLAVSGIDSAVKKYKDKKRSNEAKEDILKGKDKK